MAHPVTLRTLVERFETLQVLHAERDTAENRRRLEDVSYTLCVSTGTRTVEAALTTAREWLAVAPSDTAGPAGRPTVVRFPAKV